MGEVQDPQGGGVMEEVEWEGGEGATNHRHFL